MTELEFRDAKKRIIESEDVVEITYKKKVVDEFGTQLVVVKQEYVLGDECIEEVFKYEGNTTRFRMVGKEENYKLNDTPITIDPIIEKTKEEFTQEIKITEDELVIPITSTQSQISEAFKRHKEIRESKLALHGKLVK